MITCGKEGACNFDFIGTGEETGGDVRGVFRDRASDMGVLSQAPTDVRRLVSESSASYLAFCFMKQRSTLGRWKPKLATLHMPKKPTHALEPDACILYHSERAHMGNYSLSHVLGDNKTI